jgi:hypothetical protein
MATPGTLPPDEYERRKAFLDDLKGLSKSEYVEILRILKQHDVAVSENHNGVFFNVSTLTKDAFEALQLFRRFTVSNRLQLADRELMMSSLTTALVPSTDPEKER